MCYGLEGVGDLLVGGRYWPGVVVVVDVGEGGGLSAAEWEAAIERVVGGLLVLYTYGSRSDVGAFGGG